MTKASSLPENQTPLGLSWASKKGLIFSLISKANESIGLIN